MSAGQRDRRSHYVGVCLMSDTRKLRLTDKLGYLNTEDLAPVGGCNFLCLSDRQVAIIRGFVYPFARCPRPILRRRRL
ncbi:unnamed protein product [marine sediment metagenome]|uniref:Uncharacterized protein n=1 Tax=marine sediment metagenome TaxID=412755 RepID=X1E1Q3_9ZZZZ